MCADWRAHRASLELLVKRRREAYDELFRESQATPDVDGEKNPTCQFRLLEADALAAWVSGEAPADAGTKGRDAPNFFAPAGALVQTRALRRQHRLCGHGRLRAGDVGDFCIVRVVVYDRILADLKVGEVDDRLDNPEIQCSVCFDESRSELQETRRMDDEFNALLVALAAADAASKKPAAPARGASRQAAFHVSRKFFADLKKRCEKRSRVDKTAQKTLGLYFGDAAESAKPPPGAAAAAAAAQAAVVADDKFGDGDANKDLLCAHGALKLRASALAVDEACWDALRRLLPGSTHFDAAAPACTQCELQDVAQNRQDADRQDELRRHPSLVDLVERPRQLLALQAQHAAPNGGGGTASRPKQTRSTTAPVDYVEALMPCVSNFAGSLAEERRRRRRGGRLLPADFAPLDGAGTGAAGNAAPMPLRLVRRDWLSPWRAYHEALPGGARPAGLGDLGDLREHRCGCGAERPAGGAACAPPPWLLCALGLADCDGGLAAAVAAEACEAAASLHGLVMEAAEAYEAGTEALHFDPDDVEVVTDRQWRALVAEYGGDVDAAAIARGDAAGAWTLDPPPCAGCVSAAMRKAESSWRNFSNKPIFVQHLGADLLPFPVEASDDDGASDDDAPRDGAPRRRRRRATRSTDKAPPKVYALLHSAEDRVGLLMLRLCEQLPDAEPGKRRRTLAAAGAAPALALAVYKSDGTQLTDRDATLERAGVRARDTLYVRVCGAGDAANEHAATEADLFAYATIDEQRPAARGGGRAAETGFAGTMLQGAPAPQPEVIECDEDEADAADGPEPEAWQERVVVVSPRQRARAWPRRGWTAAA
ncbi:hypothetical protein M885DRAFT_293355 [Pelagophyceae sp. CCMP2097]|nr:hypothetical protein M885DRAFT_293355 [Pelagophyceae sp. CCMP2097]